MAVAAPLGVDARSRWRASRRRAPPARPRSGRAPPPCRGHGSGRRPPACRRPRAPRRRRSRPRSRNGQEQRRARARHDQRLARRDGREGPLAPPPGDARMPFGRPHAEAPLEALEELRGERDLGHQDEALPALPHGLGHGLEIDLGLAGAGDALQQASPRSACCRHVLHQRAPRPPPGAASSAGAGMVGVGPGRDRRAAAMPTASSVPSSTSPSITAALTPAASASARLGKTRPPSAAAITRARAGVSALGRRPGEAHADLRCARRGRRPAARSAMRSTMPRGASV